MALPNDAQRSTRFTFRFLPDSVCNHSSSFSSMSAGTLFSGDSKYAVQLNLRGDSGSVVSYDHGCTLGTLARAAGERSRHQCGPAHRMEQHKECSLES